MPSRPPRSALPVLLATLALGASGGPAAPAQAQTPAGGKQDQSYAPITGSITGTKPESKLWYAHDSWWAVMGEPSKQYSIWRLDRPTETWVDTGTVVETRTAATRADALSEPDGSLTIASHTFKDQRHLESTAPTGGSNGGRLRRYSFDGANYVPMDGYPATIEDQMSETLVIDRDSTGALWATWTWNSQAWFAHTTPGADAAWSAPQPVPNTGTLDTDDISSLIHFGGDKIGIMVSNQFTNEVHFEVHQDGVSDLLWSDEVVPTHVSADDHINLKADSEGRVYAALKTSESTPRSQPLVMLAVRSAAGTWSTDVFGTVQDAHTRAILLLDESHDLIHMFATDGQSGGPIVEKTTSMDDPGLESGMGTRVIDGGPDLNDATSTKQNVDGSTGLVVLADDDQTQTYWHLDAPLGPATVSARFTATPSTGTAPLSVTFADGSLGSPTSWTWSFGDGATSTQQSPTHVYTAAGTYTVRLTVADGVTSSAKEATVTVAAPSPDQTPPPADTTPSADTTPPVTPPAVTGPVGPAPLPPGPETLPPGSTSVQTRDPLAPRLRGVIQLSGRRVSTVISCRTSGRAALSHRGTRLASARFTCKGGRAVVRFRLGPKGARRLRATRKPEVALTVRIGATTTKLRHRLSRGTD